MIKLVNAIKKLKGYLEYGVKVLDIVIGFIDKFDGVIKLDAELEAKIAELDK